GLPEIRGRVLKCTCLLDVARRLVVPTPGSETHIGFLIVWPAPSRQGEPFYVSRQVATHTRRSTQYGGSLAGSSGTPPASIQPTLPASGPDVTVTLAPPSSRSTIRTGVSLAILMALPSAMSASRMSAGTEPSASRNRTNSRDASFSVKKSVSP